MGITINTNVASLGVQRRLSDTSAFLSKSISRLSSGVRITSASDDAAGLAIADSLRADMRISSVAIRNANDAVSMVSIADGALNEIGRVLSRMAELAEQSANGVLNNTQRSALDSEFSSLGNEIQRIADSTKFNDISLLSGGSEVALQVGFDSQENSRITFSGVEGTLSALGLGSESGDTTYKFSDFIYAPAYGWTDFQTAATNGGATGFYIVSDSDANELYSLPGANGLTLEQLGTKYDVTLANWNNFANNHPNSWALLDSSLTVFGTSTTTSLVYSLSAATESDSLASSRDALDAVNNAITSLSTYRSILGAVESRLSTALSNLQVARENYAAAESQIRDIDVASEAATLTRLNILQQASSSVLAQANQQPQLALRLIG